MLGWLGFILHMPSKMPFPTHLKAKEAFEKVSKDKSVYVIVLQSEPSMAFCAGASYDELLAVNTPERESILWAL